MYDKCLVEDLRNFKKGAETVYELQYRYESINKIIKNRTKEKIDFLNYILKENAIDNELYNEFMRRIESDFRQSHLYIVGLMSLD